ncbi:MAG: phosphoribosylamine--glycine ligase [Gammaproteobacteria bacterium]|nr:MAG: phosphoribosylamine--glycine ligase [Gammaproteobacteria bacterium]
MKILVIGGGGREHALAWKLSQSPSVTKIFVAPGNAGTAVETKTENIAIDVENISELKSFAKQEKIDLTIVGPEAPLVAGIVDEFNPSSLPIYGPTAATAQLEGSKAFAKQFMQQNGIPTGGYAVFTNYQEAEDFISSQSFPIVIKADGLAAGKGVVIAQNKQEALQCAEHMLSGSSFGNAGHRIVVEEFIQGEEASFICMVDGKNILPLASSQDHKARDDGDQGPNTGGMGAYSPAPIVDTAMHQKILDQVITPVVNGFAKQGTPYVGFLYAGLMIGEDLTPKVLEFNCRFGDPETQPILMRMQSDFAELCLAGANQQLDQHTIKWDTRVALGVVLAAGGYPENYKKGEIIQGLPEDSATQKVFHAGTKIDDGNVVTNGGRVLCATALGDNITEAQKLAYKVVKKINWPNMFYRNDIGYRAIKK